MGRPINKRNFGPGPGGWGITAYRRRGGFSLDNSGLAIDGIWIKRQASTRDFIITDGVWEERMTIDLASNAASLEEGRFVIAAYDENGVQVSVEKISAHKWAFIPNRGTEAQGGTWVGPSDLIQVADISVAAPPVVTTATPHRFQSGDAVNLHGLPTAEFDFLEGAQQTITVIDDVSFSLNGEDTQALDAYSGTGGTVVRILPQEGRGYIAGSN